MIPREQLVGGSDSGLLHLGIGGFGTGRALHELAFANRDFGVSNPESSFDVLPPARTWRALTPNALRQMMR